jgi:hypothetical protein
VLLSILVKSSNTSDSKFIENHLNAMLIVTKSQNYMHQNRYKQYILYKKRLKIENIFNWFKKTKELKNYMKSQ